MTESTSGSNGPLIAVLLAASAALAVIAQQSPPTVKIMLSLVAAATAVYAVGLIISVWSYHTDREV